MLSSAHHLTGSTDERLYKLTHKNHPCSVWVRESKGNYQWLYEHFKALCELYTVSSGKVHKTEERLSEVLSHVPDLPDNGLTQFAVAMPEEHQVADVCMSYRTYMNAKLAEWLDREKPMKVEWTLEVPKWIGETVRGKMDET